MTKEKREQLIQIASKNKVNLFRECHEMGIDDLGNLILDFDEYCYVLSQRTIIKEDIEIGESLTFVCWSVCRYISGSNSSQGTHCPKNLGNFDDIPIATQAIAEDYGKTVF